MILSCSSWTWLNANFPEFPVSALPRLLFGIFMSFTNNVSCENGSVEPIKSVTLLLTNLGVDRFMKGSVVSFPAVKLFDRFAQLPLASHDLTSIV